MIKLGITGGIGSGKSYVSEYLRIAGVPVFDSDSEARKIMLTDSYVVSSLKQLLGDDVYSMDGSLNKKLLSDYIFSSTDNANKVNAIVHPCVKNAFLEWANSLFKTGVNIVAIESAILFEAGFDEIVDKVTVVDAPLDIRVSRVLRRDKTTKEQIMARINSQMDNDIKIARADYVIVNDGIRSVDVQITSLLNTLR